MPYITIFDGLPKHEYPRCESDDGWRIGARWQKYYKYQPIDQMDKTSQTQPYYQSVAIIVIILNAISLTSLCFVLGIYIYNWKKIASFPMRLSFYLCLACLGQNLYVILLNPITIHTIETNNGERTSPYCIFEGILKVGFDLSSIIWTTLIIYSIYASVVLKKVLDARECIYLGIAFLLPFVAACIPAIFGLYGYVQYFCWFEDNTDNINEIFWLKMGFFFIPLWTLFFVNLGLSIKTYLQLKRIQLEKRLLQIFQRLMLFPFIMFVTGLFATVDLIYYEVNRDYVAWLDVTGLVLLSLYGFFNSIAYGFNPLIRDRIQVCIKGHEHSSVNDSIHDDRSESSRDTEKIEAQLYDIRSVRRPTEPMINNNNIKK